MKLSRKEVVVSSSMHQQQGQIHIWDITTNAILATLNQNNSSSFVVVNAAGGSSDDSPIGCCTPSLASSLILAYQIKKTAIHVWNFNSVKKRFGICRPI